MKFDLTIQEAIEAMENDHISCMAFLHPHVHYMVDHDRLYFKNINETAWREHDHPARSVRFSFDLIKSKWAIYEDPKEEKKGLFDRWDGKKNYLFTLDGNAISAAFPGLYNNEHCHAWEYALITFMRLKSHPLAVPVLDDIPQFVIKTSFWSTDGLYLQKHYGLATKITEVSPCFSCEEDGEKAISDIGEDNILHMMRTFQGIYE